MSLRNQPPRIRKQVNSTLGIRVKKNLSQRLQIAAIASIAVMLTGCGLPGPTHKSNAQIALDNRPDCSVFGVWEHYTWSGECQGGLASGQGTLLGYAGSTLMLRYVGEMKAGLRDGWGEMWINGDKIHGGPTTRSGRFARGGLVTGAETNNYSVRNYTNGENSSTTYTSEKSESSSGVGSMTAGLLGAVALGAAAGGGKNAAQLQAMGSALQGTASASPPIRSTSAGTNNGASSADTSPPVNGCAHLTPVLKPAYNDADMFIENTCSYPIVVVVCNVAATSQSCTHQYSQVKPNARYGLGGGFAPKTTYASFSCKAPYYPNVRLAGGVLSGGCTSVPAY
ncbi:MORN repeat-containing protein [Pandoraea pneumonica]|uniref:MORN repeat-containing protein n=1 Tax=Pandoraea pneumonica TaxID=2508299 RepID=A0A5E4X4U6_9BURK|nr:MORN repeat-containing protein [Pandoraea pneumonica]